MSSRCRIACDDELIFAAGDAARSTCVHAATAISRYARSSRSLRCRSSCAAALRACARERAASAIAVVWRAVPARTDRKNLRRQQDVRRRGREIRARRNRAQIRSGARIAQDFPLRQFRRRELRRSRAPSASDFSTSAARGNPRARRPAVGRADASAAGFTRREFAASARRRATWCPEGAFARCTTGIPTSRWWACRPAAATISWPTWSKTLPASSIGTGTFRTAAAATT